MTTVSAGLGRAPAPCSNAPGAGSWLLLSYGATCTVSKLSTVWSEIVTLYFEILLSYFKINFVINKIKHIL